MFLELDKNDLISIVMGTNPNFSVMGHNLIIGKGRFNGHSNTWSWYRSKLEELTEYQLWDVYQICKSSWNKP